MSTTPDPARPYRIVVVCTGNICRSPMGEFILRELFDEAGLGDRVQVDSAGTSSWETGNPADRRTLEVLRRNGHADFGGTDHVARQFEHTWLEDRDLVLAMDTANLADVRAAGPATPDGRVRLFRDFDPVGPGGDVPDPYYGGDAGFEEVLAMVERTADALVAALRALPARPGPASRPDVTGPRTS